MLTRASVGTLFTVLTLTLAPAALAQSASPSSKLAPLTDAEVHARGEQLIANQHKNDDMVDFYDRVEHQVETTGGANPRTIEDKTIRFAPNGAGATKILLKDGTQEVSAADYTHELQVWLGVAQFMSNPNDERAKAALAKYSKRKQDRAHLVDSLLTAYIPKWAGTEMREAIDCDVFTLTPDPAFRPRSIFEEALPHASVKIWVDRNADQLIRAEALITSDVSVGGGVLGKLYKGGTFSMDQAEEVPGVWLPTRYQFDFSGRKFFFSFENHQSIGLSHYRYIGSARDALAAAQAELANGKPQPADP
jgi:hypothetical protein